MATLINEAMSKGAEELGVRQLPPAELKGIYTADHVLYVGISNSDDTPCPLRKLRGEKSLVT